MKKAARLLGLLVAVAAGYYFFRQAAAAWSSVDLSGLLSWKSMALVLGALLLYLAQILFATMIWRWILQDMSVRLPMPSAYAIIATTQFAKYLPGNVAQHIGRVAVARNFGGDVPKLALSLIYENVIALLAGVHITVVFLALRSAPALERWLPMGSKALLLGIATVGALLAFVLLPRVVSYLQHKRGLDTGNIAGFHLSPRKLLYAYGMFLVSFLTLGLSFTLLTHAVSPQSGFPFPALCGAFAAAWVIGLLVPGAPAGLGVREGVLVALLAGVTSGAGGVAAIALLRIVTTLGDFIHFVLGTWMLRTLPKPIPPTNQP